MLASGAHVSIDGVECILARDNDNKLLYQDSFETLFANTSSIAGEIAADQLRPNRIRWAITDWIGGEGATVYYPQNPAQYDQAHLMNVTKRGQLTTRTKRRRTAVARAGANATTEKRPIGGSAYSHAIIAWEDNIIESTDGGVSDAWAAAQDITPAMSDNSYTQALTDGRYIAFLSNDGTDVPMVDPTSAVNSWSDISASGDTQNGVGFVIDGIVYVWSNSGGTAMTLFKKDGGLGVAGDFGGTTIFTSGIDPEGTYGTNWWTSAAGAETGGFFSYSTKTQAFIFEVRNDVARPFWTGDPGLAIKHLIYKSGILFALGSQAAAGNTFATLVAIPLQTRTPVTAAEPRKHQNTSLANFDVGCAGLGDYIFCGDSFAGKIFVYDIRNDALSLFDDLANGGTGDGTSFTASDDRIGNLFMHGARLIAPLYEPDDAATTSLQVVTWDDLEVQNRDGSQAISANLETAAWDMGLPMETKALMGFDVVYKVTDTNTTSGLVANSRITISYSMDDASYSTTVASGASATITSATTPSSGIKGRHYIQVSDGTTTQKFTRLKVKITLDNNSQSNVAPPILFNVVVDTRPMAYERTWDLVIQAEDEEQNDRPTSRQNSGKFIRDAINSAMTNKDVVPFVDGVWSENPGVTSSHTVVIESPVGSLSDSLGQGQIAVRLRSVT